jgi:hypothetical protein
MRPKVIPRPTSEIGVFVKFGLVLGHRLVALVDPLDSFVGHLSQVKRDKPPDEYIFKLPPVTIIEKFSMV